MDNKRKFKRIPENIQVSYKIITLGPIGEETPTSNDDGISENISEGGILLQANEKLPLSTFLEIEIRLSDYEFPLYFKGRVIRVQKMDNDERFDTGIMFTQAFEKDKQLLQDYIQKYENDL